MVSVKDEMLLKYWRGKRLHGDLQNLKFFSRSTKNLIIGRRWRILTSGSFLALTARKRMRYLLMGAFLSSPLEWSSLLDLLKTLPWIESRNLSPAINSSNPQIFHRQTQLKVEGKEKPTCMPVYPRRRHSYGLWWKRSRLQIKDP